MSIAPEQKNPLEIVREWRSTVAARTNITNFTKDSKTRALLDINANEVVSLRRQALESYYSQQLTRARGAQLDRIGADMGVPRLSSTFSSADAREQNFAFYVDSGVFGDYNGGADINIPVDAILYSDANQNELGSRIEYRVTDATVGLATESMVYVSVRAKEAGLAYNVSGSVIRTHNFTNYTASGTGAIKCINMFSVINGREVEEDESYRFRLSKRYDVLLSRNNSRIMLSALQIPGVVDIRVVPGYFGIGTAGVIVLGPDYEANSAILSAVQGQLDSIQVPGLRALATAATKVSLDLEAQVKFNRPMNSAEKSQFEIEVRRVIKNHMRSIPIGDSISLSDVEYAVHKQTKGVLQLGRRDASSSQIFKNVYVRRGASNGFSSEREKMVADTRGLLNDEFFDIGEVTFVYN